MRPAPSCARISLSSARHPFLTSFPSLTLCSDSQPCMRAAQPLDEYGCNRRHSLLRHPPAQQQQPVTIAAAAAVVQQVQGQRSQQLAFQEPYLGDRTGGRVAGRAAGWVVRQSSAAAAEGRSSTAASAAAALQAWGPFPPFFRKDPFSCRAPQPPHPGKLSYSSYVSRACTFHQVGPGLTSGPSPAQKKPPPPNAKQTAYSTWVGGRVWGATTASLSIPDGSSSRQTR